LKGLFHFDAVEPILVCESVRGLAMADLLRARDAVTRADLVELRLDGVPQPDPVAAIAGRRLPAVVTCRPRWEGGAFDGDEATREAWLDVALRAGAEFVDVEWRAPWRAGFLSRWPGRVVLSWHDFEGTPPDLVRQAGEMAAAGAAVVKVAVMTWRLRDLEPLFTLRRAFGPATRAVVIGMGAAGAVTRILPHRFGSAWTYAGDGVAPGQLSTSRLVQEFRVRATTPGTAIFGVVGPAAGALPATALHNAAFATRGIDAVCVPFETGDFEDFVAIAERLDIAGASVTHPLTAAARQTAVRADAEAVRTGTADGVRREADGTWVAANAEVEAFLAPLAGQPLAGARAAVLGSGPGARAAVAGLAARGAVVAVYDAAQPEAAQDVAEQYGGEAGTWPPELGAWDLLVNTTDPAEHDRPAVEASIVHGGLVYDLVCDLEPSRLMAAAADRGCRTVGGLETLVAHTARQFEWWTGQPAPTDVMRAAALQRLAEIRAARARTMAER
jgi:3-dehydroquinate dehydratase/shikimate dehydrogenase